MRIDGAQNAGIGLSSQFEQRANAASNALSPVSFAAAGRKVWFGAVHALPGAHHVMVRLRVSCRSCRAIKLKGAASDAIEEMIAVERRKTLAGREARFRLDNLDCAGMEDGVNAIGIHVTLSVAGTAPTAAHVQNNTPIWRRCKNGVWKDFSKNEGRENYLSIIEHALKAY